MKQRRRRMILLLCVAGIVCLLSDACRRNWILHARLNVLLSGCLNCHVESPGDLGSLPVPPTGFVSALVYRNGVCIGYLDRNGALVLPNESNASVAERELKLFVILLGLEIISGAIFIAVSVALLWKRFGPRASSKSNSFAWSEKSSDRKHDGSVGG